MSEPVRAGPDDADLIGRAQGGEARAFGELYERYVGRLYRYIYSWVGNRSDAEDLTELVFLRAYQALHRYRFRGLPFSAYLYKIARNVLVDHHRRRREEVSLAAVEGEAGEPNSVDDQVIQRAQRAALRHALASLPPDYAEIIRLRLLLELPTADAATWMGRSEGAVRVLLYRALRLMREKLMTDEH
jgi:RNA polymerase sigma-70 factor (ECF subfamily)